jgi:hypothetical protein
VRGDPAARRAEARRRSDRLEAFAARGALDRLFRHWADPSPSPGALLASGRKICRLDLDAIGMQRPVAKRLRLAESFLGELSGFIFVQRDDFHCALTDLALPAVFAEHILHEVDDKP